MALAIVLAIRLTLPLTIIRSPFWGGLLAIAADTVDILVFQLLSFPGFVEYHELDKVLDLYYLSLELIVAQRWEPLPRLVSSALFAYRLAGTVLFEFTGNRGILLFFPNVFELFFLLHAYLQRYRPSRGLTAQSTATWLAVLIVPKLGQEYVLHSAKLLDDLVAVEVIRAATASVVHWFGARV